MFRGGDARCYGALLPCRLDYYAITPMMLLRDVAAMLICRYAVTLL